MAHFKLFHPLDYTEVADLSADLITMSYNEQAYGSLDGTAQIEVTEENRVLLSSLKECSHFLKLSPDAGGIVGAVIKDAYIDRNICHVAMVGFLEYLEMVPLMASHKAVMAGPSTTVPAEDPSWTKIFYAKSNLGLFLEIFLNLSATMVAQGYQPFFLMVGIQEIVTGTEGEEWGKSYRLNSLETPNAAEVYSDLTEDDEFLPVRVSVAEDGNFQWLLTGIVSYELSVINEAQDMVHTVGIERGQKINRAMALATGTDVKDNNLISRIPFSQNAAYSATFAEDSSRGSLDIARSNRAQIAGAELRQDQISFTTYDASIKIFSAVSIFGTNLANTLAVITQKKIDGQAVTYTGTIVSSVDQLIPGVKKPTSEARRLIYEPAKKANRRSIRQGLEKKNRTGWR